MLTYVSNYRARTLQYARRSNALELRVIARCGVGARGFDGKNALVARAPHFAAVEAEKNPATRAGLLQLKFASVFNSACDGAGSRSRQVQRRPAPASQVRGLPARA